MTKYYCKYCDFRTIRNYRLDNHYIDVHSFDIQKGYIIKTYKKFDLKFVNNFMNKTINGHNKMTDLIKDFVKKYNINIKTIYDIGANVGIVSLFYSKKFHNSQIYSFEPIKSTFNILENNIKLNNAKNITPLNFGIYKENKNSKLYIPNNRETENIGLYSLKLDKKNGINPENITLKRLNELNLPQPDFVKLDAEGFEYDIINDNKEIFKKCSLILTEEFDEKKKNFYNIEKNKNIFDLIKSLNFKIIHRKQNDYIFINKNLL